MSVRVLAMVLVLGVLGLGFAAWWTQREKPAALATSGAAVEPGGMPPAAGVPPGAGDGDGNEPASPGLKWSVPSGWSTQPERAMRFATYSIPPASGDKEGAECAVFYFGPGQGGDVKANLDRWVGQFEQARIGTRAERTVHGVKVTTVDVHGTYLAPSGPMMESQGRLEKYSLLGAIAEGPLGSVFFKLTGPENTVKAAQGAFDSMIGSLTRE